MRAGGAGGIGGERGQAGQSRARTVRPSWGQDGKAASLHLFAAVLAVGGALILAIPGRLVNT